MAVWVDIGCVAGAISFSCVKHSDLHLQRLKEVFETLVTFWSIFADGKIQIFAFLILWQGEGAAFPCSACTQQCSVSSAMLCHSCEKELVSL